MIDIENLTCDQKKRIAKESAWFLITIIYTVIAFIVVAILINPKEAQSICFISNQNTTSIIQASIINTYIRFALIIIAYIIRPIFLLLLKYKPIALFVKWVKWIINTLNG